MLPTVQVKKKRATVRTHGQMVTLINNFTEAFKLSRWLNRWKRCPNWDNRLFTKTNTRSCYFSEVWNKSEHGILQAKIFPILSIISRGPWIRFHRHLAGQQKQLCPLLSFGHHPILPQCLLQSCHPQCVPHAGYHIVDTSTHFPGPWIAHEREVAHVLLSIKPLVSGLLDENHRTWWNLAGYS